MSEQMTSEAGTTNEQPTATPAAKGDEAAPKPEPVMIPKERLDAEIAKTREYKKAAEELAKLKQEQADAEAKRTGDVERFQKERDSYKAEADHWNAYASAKLEGLMEQLDDAGKGILADLEDAPLAKRLAIAEKLATTKKSEPGFGTNGGTASKTAGGVIPPNIQSMGEYHNWLANLRTTPEGLSLLADRKKMETIRAEAQTKFRQ